MMKMNRRTGGASEQLEDDDDIYGTDERDYSKEYGDEDEEF
jgi:hypothetical protein